MQAVSPELLDDWQPLPLAFFEEQIAGRCAHCDTWAEDAGDPDWVRQLEAEANGRLAVESVLEPVESVGWAIPGVTGLDRPAPAVLPAVSPVVAELLAAFDRVVAQPSDQPDGQALVDAEALLGLEQRLRVHSISRVTEVGRRGLQELVGFKSLRTWLRARRPDGDASDGQLGQQLRDYPVLKAAVDAGLVPISSARRMVKALGRCWHQLDRPDHLIDGQPGDQVLRAVIGNTIASICRFLNGLHDHDPRLAALIDRGRLILDQPASQRSQVEAILTLLAEHIPPRSLAGCLEEIVLSLLPSKLDEAAAAGEAASGLELKRKPDGSGFKVDGDLSLECGERLITCLRGEAARDPDNTNDTLAWQAQRARETADCPFTGAAAPPTEPEPAGDGPLWFQMSDQLLPRSKARRMHDALNRLLARYLDQGLGGTVNKLPVQIAVTITEQCLTNQPGAAPARTESGALIPRAMVKRWWCDSHVTTFVLSLGGKALRAVHAQRTLSPLERRALQIETGGRCAGQGCCPDQPDPLQTLIPHHVTMYSTNGRTSLEETLGFCLSTHQDLHEGKRTIQLRDGRYLNEHGFTTTPPWPNNQPPF